MNRTQKAQDRAWLMVSHSEVSGLLSSGTTPEMSCLGSNEAVPSPKHWQGSQERKGGEREPLRAR